MNENMCINTSQDLKIIRKIKVLTVNLGICYFIKKGMFEIVKQELKCIIS